jgi:predicted aldo/keto reductase-like oxidoreductase
MADMPTVALPTMDTELVVTALLEICPDKDMLGSVIAPTVGGTITRPEPTAVSSCMAPPPANRLPLVALTAAPFIVAELIAIRYTKDISSK